MSAAKRAPSARLPPKLDLQNLKKRAKHLLRAHKARDATALLRIKRFFPRLAVAADAEVVRAQFSLQDAQLVIAREHGFASWPKMKRELERSTALQNQDEIRAAIEGGDLGAVRQLIEADPGLLRLPVPTGVSAKERGQILRYRPVTLAAVKGQTEILCWLIAAGGDPAEYGNFPLCRAALYENNIPVMEILVRHGADVNGVGNDYGPPLIFAIEGENLGIMAWLLERGAAIAGSGPSLDETVPWNALKHAGYFNKRCPGMLALLIEHGADVNSAAVDPVKGVPRGSALHNAAEKDDLEGVKLLLRHGADPDAENEDGQRPIDLAGDNEVRGLLAGG